MHNTFWRMAVVAVLIVLGCALESRAQDRLTQVSFSFGLIENMQDDADQPHYAFYPELQVSTKLAHLDKAPVALGGSLYWGYWSDGVNTLSNCADCRTYAYDSHIVGVRVLAMLKVPFSARVVGGVSKHIFHGDYVGGAGVVGDTGKDFSDSFSAAEMGLRVGIPLYRRLSLGGNVQRYMPLVHENSPHSARIAFGVGLAYRL